MPTVELSLPGHSYAVRIEPGGLARLGPWLREAADPRHARAALFADENVAAAHRETARKSLEEAGYETLRLDLAISERLKTLDTLRRLYDVLLDHKLERRSPIVSLGGGVLGDTVGFAAATYLRGVPFVQCPTTLLAMVDASVGGKVGVNVPQGKNLIGAFHQPCLVAIDPDVLAGLPARELRCGLAECVKHGVIRDASLVDWIEANLDAILALDRGVLAELVRRNVSIKAAVVQEDPREEKPDVRAQLNLGHTFAHAIESQLGYGELLHGEAVALGMIAAAHLAVRRGTCDPGVPERLTRLLERIGLPLRAALPPSDVLLGAMRLDKKVQEGRIRLVLPDGLGRASVVDDVDDTAIAAAWDTIRA